ncbi:MAG: YvcK family protein [Acidobacteria bacterium]|nr:YvcK family protein [Acidobacteriota bacterium]
MTANRPLRPIRLVAIGGGTGLSTLLKGLREDLVSAQPGISLTAIVTVSDDGKSSGRLREEFSVLPPGDIRNCLVALAGEDESMTQLFRHRFPGDGSIGGHSLGNLIILALTQMSGSFLKAIEQASEMLGINARILPATLENVDLIARVDHQLIKVR